MPKLYEYLGLIIFFYSNEHEPVHVHGRFEDRENKAELIIVSGQVVDILFKPVAGKNPLSRKQMSDFKKLVQIYSKDIVKKWVDYFVYHKNIKAQIIQKKV